MSPLSHEQSSSSGSLLRTRVSLRMGSLMFVAASLLWGLWSISQTPDVRRDTDYIPADDICLSALAKSLEAWCAGAGAGPVAGTTPIVHVTDSSRVKQRPLLSWQILGKVPGNAPSCFAVQLKLDQPVEERRERYVVIGIDPLWVFRHDDYDLLLHWEHPMELQPDRLQPAADGGKPQ
ncbi:MAG: hypothetical protein ACKO2P_12670 [Planctomycetota bacterium]